MVQMSTHLTSRDRLWLRAHPSQIPNSDSRLAQDALQRRPLDVFDGSADHSIFAIPILDQFLLYAPLHNLAALIDPVAVAHLLHSLLFQKSIDGGPLSEILHILSTETDPVPSPRQGDLSPAFMGLLPTRGCNLSCRYCGFVTQGESTRVMDLQLARGAVDWYLGLVGRSGLRQAEIHYFGGEPFCAAEVLDVTTHQARIMAEKRGVTVRFEIATNGVFSERRAAWAADNLDTIVLSLDGPADIHDQYRPCQDGRGSFAMVDRSARILAEGAAQLFFRTCVTDQTVGRMPELAAWFCRNYHPKGVCFEPVQPMARPGSVQLEPPDPWEFARNFVQAARVLEAYGVEPVYTAADISTRRVSFCPVGQDVAIVSPDGAISACYLLRRDWQAKWPNLDLGHIEEGGVVELNEEAVTSARGLNVWNKPFCAHCFCKWHCAGGCHVNHVLPDRPAVYDRLCIQTRIITLHNILKAMGREDLTEELLAAPQALETAVRQASDTLFDGGARL
jgi:uncharacterized protein